MAIVLRDNQYGKAETRVVRIYRDTERHEIRDLNVSTALRGDFAAAHLAGDQASVLPTDSQKNTCFAYAKERGVGAIEEYALALSRHFVDDIASVPRARVDVDEYRWERVAVAGAEHAAYVRPGRPRGPYRCGYDRAPRVPLKLHGLFPGSRTSSCSSRRDRSSPGS